MAQYTFDTLTNFEKSTIAIPNEYQLVEYLGISRNNSNDHINSNVLTQKGLRITIGFKPLSILEVDSIFGNRSDGESNSFGITYGSYPRAYYGQRYSSYNAFATTDNRYDLDYNNINGKLYVNGSLNTDTPNAETYNYTNPVPILIGRMGNWSGLSGAKDIYYCHISVYDNWVLKLYPVYRKEDNVAGMYDIVNGTFYTNQGTGAFSVGSDFPTPIYQNGDTCTITELNLTLTSNGTDWLVTNDIIIPTLSQATQLFSFAKGNNGVTATITDVGQVYIYQNAWVYYYTIVPPLVFRGITFEQTDYWQKPEMVFRGISFEITDKVGGASMFHGMS